MAKELATEVQTGAAGTDGGRPAEDASELDLRSSPKRDKILTGMLQAVGAKGYDATSVRTVLDRTGLYRQAFYDNFADKDACYLAALELGIEQFEAAAAKGAAGADGWRDRLRGGLVELLELLDSDPDFGRGVIVEVHAAGPKAQAKRSGAMKRAADFIRLAQLEANGAESPPQIAPEGIVAGIHAIVHSRLSTGATGGFRELLPEFMYFAVMPYFGAEVASAEMQAASA